MFQISLENSFKNDVYLGYHTRLQPSEIDRLPYYRYEYYIQHLTAILQEKKDIEDGQTRATQQDTPSINKAMGDMRKMMPSSPFGQAPKFPALPPGLKI